MDEKQLIIGCSIILAILLFLIFGGCLGPTPQPAIIPNQPGGQADLSLPAVAQQLGAHDWSIKTANGTTIMEKRELNSYDASRNAWLDCDILTCTLKDEITPRNVKSFKNADFAGEINAAVGGNCTFIRSYFLDWNMTQISTPIFKTENLTCTSPNGTARICGEEKIFLFNEITYENRTFENENLSKIDRTPGHPTTIYREFKKSKPDVACDISTLTAGISSANERAWWNNSCTTKIPLTNYYNKSIATAQPNLIAFASVNTSGGAYNCTVGLNFRVLNFTEDGIRPAIIMSTNSTFLCNATNNATISYITDMNPLLNNTTDYLYLCPVATPPRFDTNSSIAGGYCNLANLTNFWPAGEGSGATLADICSNNTATLLGNAHFNSSGQHGFGIRGTNGNTNDGLSFTGVAVGSTYTLWTLAEEVSSDTYRTMWSKSGTDYHVLVWAGSPLGHLGSANGFSDSGFDETTLAQNVLHGISLACNAGSGQFYINGSAAGSAITCKTSAIDRFMTQGGGQTWDRLTEDPMMFNVSKTADYEAAFYALHVAVGGIQNMSGANNTQITAISIAPSVANASNNLSCNVTATSNTDASFLVNISFSVNGSATNLTTTKTCTNSNTQINTCANATNILDNSTNWTVQEPSGTPYNGTINLTNPLLLPSKSFNLVINAGYFTGGDAHFITVSVWNGTAFVDLYNLTQNAFGLNVTYNLSTATYAPSGSVWVRFSHPSNGNPIHTGLEVNYFAVVPYTEYGIATNTATLFGNVTSIHYGENWSCSAQAISSNNISATNTSSNRTIINTNPAIASNASFTNASAGHWFYANATASDPDGGPHINSWNITSSVGSCANFSNATSGNNRSVVFNCSSVIPGKAAVNITFTDAGGASNWTNGSNSYADLNGSITLAINDSAPRQNSTLNFSMNFSDPDGDLENSSNRTQQWYLNGTLIPGATGATLTLNSTYFPIGGNVSVCVNTTAQNWTTSNPKNCSANVTIANPPLLVNFSSGIYTLFFNATTFVQKNVSATNQTASLGVYNITYASSGLFNMTCNQTPTIPGFSMKVATSFNVSASTICNGSVFYNSTNSTGTIMVWAWASFYFPQNRTQTNLNVTIGGVT